MKVVLAVAFGLPLIAASAFARNFRPIHQTSQSVVHDFLNVSECTNRIWPGYTWSHHSILVVDPKKSEGLAVDVGSKKVYQIPLDAFPKEKSIETSVYSFFSSQGRDWISLNRSYGFSSGLPHAVFNLGVHEAFHHIAQRDWKRSAGSRGTEIPIQWQPRFYRAMVHKNLRKYFLGKDDGTLLSQARYWYNLWKTNFPNESLNTTDGYEGTAQYAEGIGAVLATKGCDVAESRLKESIQKSVAGDFSLLQYYGKVGADSEGYFLGSIAGFILRFDSPNSGWEAKVLEGQTPLDILLSNVAPKSEAPDAFYVDGFQKAADEMQINAESLLGPALRAMQDKDMVILSIPYDWRSGAISIAGFYLDSSKKVRYSVVAQDMTFDSGETHLKTHSGLVDIDIGEMPCETFGRSIPLASSEIKSISSGYQIRGEKIEGFLKGSVVISASGKKWICAGQ